MNFEENLKKLEELLKILEDENVGFDKSVETYIEAGSLIKNSYDLIKEAKGKVVEVNEKLEEIDFDGIIL